MGKAKKLLNCNCSLEDVDTVIVYGDVNGFIKKCNTVIVINGDVNGDIKDNKMVGGYLANNPISDDALWEKAGAGARISRNDLGIM